MFINNINPVLLSIGSLQIRYYGIIYALGFVIGYLFMHYQVKHGKLHLTGEKLDSYFLWLIIWILIGARLFEILFFSPGYYFSNPSEMILVLHGGLRFHGGLVAAIIFTYLFREDTVYFGLSTGQWFSALMIVVAVVFLYKIKNNRI